MQIIPEYEIIKKRSKKRKTSKNITITTNFQMKHIIQKHEMTKNVKTSVFVAKNIFGIQMKKISLI